MTVSTRQSSSGILGVDVTQQWTDKTPLFEFGLGSIHRTVAGDVYRLVRATAAKTIGLVYHIDENWLVGDGATTTTTADITDAFGIPAYTTTAPASIDAAATYTYFWIQTAGNFAVVTTDDAVVDNTLAYTSGTTGKPTDANSGNIIQSMKFTTATGAGANTTAFSPCELHIASA